MDEVQGRAWGAGSQTAALPQEGHDPETTRYTGARRQVLRGFPIAGRIELGNNTVERAIPPYVFAIRPARAFSADGTAR